ncbi:MAG TPA: Tex-like N-terminal domain-containing protein, partial [Spirochaetia bacterium]|nr:Tex-like N-terminal domain-containing protein [Spirochaetia bacterium]
MIDERHCRILSTELSISERQIQAAAALLDEGATVPFIARYRKEATGGLDEVQIINIRDRLEALRELDKRREAIISSIEEQGKMTDELRDRLIAAGTLTVLEDIYLPYKPKRRTRGMIAREKGLEPLAQELFAQGEMDVEAAAAAYIDPEKDLPTTDEVLAGARDIIAEWINEDADARSAMREFFLDTAVLTSTVIKGKEEEGAKYRDYFDWSEPAKTAPSHRILAIRRGAEEGFLSFHILPDEEEGIELLSRRFVRGNGAASKQVALAAEDAYKRLLSLSMETEVRSVTKEKADEYAIHVFAENLRELLLASPLGQKSILALDPGLRTGCKLVCLDPQGKLIHTDTIYPLAPHNKVEESSRIIQDLVKSLSIEAIAIGNGTGGREALAFVKGIQFDRNVTIAMVNESGASVYSASEVARREFPDYDVTVRGSVSIGRRLMDPLAELVKIEPKSIGVGQYQHDVDQRALKKSLDDVVVSCVNAVGVEVNTASTELLS